MFNFSIEFENKNEKNNVYILSFRNIWKLCLITHKFNTKKT